MEQFISVAMAMSLLLSTIVAVINSGQKVVKLGS